MTRRGLVVVLFACLACGCGGNSASSSGFFDGQGAVENNGWDMQLARLSPDGSRLAVIGVTPHGSWVVGLASHGTVTQLPAAIDGGVAEDLAWTPDSNRLYVAVTPLGGTSDTRIVCVGADGSSCPGVTVNGDWHHANRTGMDVSPDGSTVAISGFPGARDNDDHKASVIYLFSTGSAGGLTTLPGGSGAARVFPLWRGNATVEYMSGSPAGVGAVPGGATVMSEARDGSTTTTVSPPGVTVDALGGTGADLIWHVASSTDSHTATGMYDDTVATGTIHFLGDYAGDHPQLAADRSYLIYNPLRAEDGGATIVTVEVSG